GAAFGAQPRMERRRWPHQERQAAKCPRGRAAGQDQRLQRQRRVLRQIKQCALCRAHCGAAAGHQFAGRPHHAAAGHPYPQVHGEPKRGLGSGAAWRPPGLPYGHSAEDLVYQAHRGVYCRHHQI
ncbi:hypothetical protein GGI22_006147, partial [Coemansia erecta]